jgi:hypothetical protein
MLKRSVDCGIPLPMRKFAPRAKAGFSQGQKRLLSQILQLRGGHYHKQTYDKYLLQRIGTLFRPSTLDSRENDGKAFDDLETDCTDRRYPKMWPARDCPPPFRADGRPSRPLCTGKPTVRGGLWFSLYLLHETHPNRRAIISLDHLPDFNHPSL